MRETVLKVLATLVAVTIVFQFNIVMAANATTQLKDEKSSNNEEISHAESHLKEVQGEKSQAMNEVENLDNKINNYESEIENLDSKISSLNNDIGASETKIAEVEDECKKTDALLSERLVLMYEDGNTSYIDFLLSSEGLTDFLSKFYMLSELTSYDMELLEQMNSQKKTIQDEKTKLENSKTELDNSKSQKKQVQSELELAKGEKSKQVEQLSGEEKNIQAKIDQLKQDNKAIDAKIAAAQAMVAAEIKRQQQLQKQQEEQQKQQQEAKSTGKTTTSSSTSSSSSSSSSKSTSSSSTTTTTSKTSTGFIRPVSGYSVTTGWYYSSGALHGAVDFSGSGISGKPVLAVADGIVVYTAALSTSYGNYIIIAHYNGLYTLYAHGQAGSIAVSTGQTVKQGQQIMRVGSTGNSTGPHLHFEVRKSPGKFANRVNPLSYLP